MFEIKCQSESTGMKVILIDRRIYVLVNIYK